MNDALASVIVGVVGAICGLLGVLVQRLRAENRDQHSDALSAIEVLHADVLHVRDRLDEHIDRHHDNDNDGR
jgi:hypothetical protein